MEGIDRPWSSLAEGGEGFIGPNGQLLGSCQIEKTYSTHKASVHTYWANHFLLLKISMDRPDMAIAL